MLSACLCFVFVCVSSLACFVFCLFIFTTINNLDYFFTPFQISCSGATALFRIESLILHQMTKLRHLFLACYIQACPVWPGGRWSILHQTVSCPNHQMRWAGSWSLKPHWESPWAIGPGGGSTKRVLNISQTYYFALSVFLKLHSFSMLWSILTILPTPPPKTHHHPTHPPTKAGHGHSA